jgi:dolichol kinase
MTDALSLTHAEAVAVEIYTFLREIDSVRWRIEMQAALCRRLESIKEGLSGLLGTTPSADVAPTPVYYRLVEVSLILSEYAPTPTGSAKAARREWKLLRKQLLPVYESLAAGLRAEDVALPVIRPTNYARIGTHMSAMVLALVLLHIPMPPFVLMLIAGVSAAICWTLELTRCRSARLNAFLMHIFRRIAHPIETFRPNSATWFTTSLFLLSCIGSSLVASLAVLILGLGDPIAGLIGRRWGHTRLINERSLEGSLAFVTASFLAVMGYLVIAAPELTSASMVLLASVASVTGATAELLSRRVDDNLAIPLGVAAIVAPTYWFIGVSW